MFSIYLAYHLRNVLLILKKAIAGLNDLFVFKNNLNTIIVFGEGPNQKLHSNTGVLAVHDLE